MYKNGKVDSVWGPTLPKIRIASKTASSKSCLKLNFVQKSQRTHMSISPQSGAWGIERFTSLKNNDIQKPESRYSLGLDAAKNTHKAYLNKSCSKLNFVQKNPRAHIPTFCLPPPRYPK